MLRRRGSTLHSCRCRWRPGRRCWRGGRSCWPSLDARLAAGDGPGPRIVVLYGLGGAGKTSVAVEYAHRHLAEVRVAWQFAAEDPTVLAAGFGELAAQLGDREPGRYAGSGGVGARGAGRVPGAVAAGVRQRGGPGSVAAFLPPAGPGRVLITSQNPAWPGQVLDVPVLDPEVAAGFLVSRTGDPDRQAARDLAGELGGLPLALEQAAAYMQATGDTLAGYLASFRQRRADLLARGEPTGYRQTVASHLGAGVRDLQQAAPGAAGLLRLLAFCAPEAIPLRLLLQPRPGLADSSAPRWRRCWCRCWRTSWRPVTRSPRCAGIRWSPRPATGWCRCTGWSRPSPPIRCPPSSPGVAAGRRRPDRGRDPRRHRPARGLAGMRGAAAARPGCPRPDQRRHMADRAVPRL